MVAGHMSEHTIQNCPTTSISYSNSVNLSDVVELSATAAEFQRTTSESLSQVIPWTQWGRKIHRFMPTFSMTTWNLVLSPFTYAENAKEIYLKRMLYVRATVPSAIKPFVLRCSRCRRRLF